MRPVLAAPDLDKEFRVEADALNYATGGVVRGTLGEAPSHTAVE